MKEINDIVDAVFGLATPTTTINTPATITAVVSASTPAPIPTRLMVPASHAKYFSRIPGDWTIPGKDNILERPITDWSALPFSARALPITLTECFKTFCNAVDIQREHGYDIYKVMFNLKPEWVEQTNSGKMSKLHYEIHGKFIDTFMRAVKWYRVHVM